MPANRQLNTLCVLKNVNLRCNTRKWRQKGVIYAIWRLKDYFLYSHPIQRK